MDWLSQTFRRLALLFHRERLDRELREEMELHLELKAKALRQPARGEAGLDEAEARAAAHRAFGNPLLLRERSREIWGLEWLASLGQDLRYGWRQLRRNPGFAAAAILTLALAIGANTAIFSLLNAVMLRPLPVPQPGRLVFFNWQANGFLFHGGFSSYGDCMFRTSTVRPVKACSFSYPIYRRFRRDHRDFSGVFATDGMQQFNVQTGGGAGLAWGRYDTGEFFSTLGLTPALGRFFGPADNRPGAAPVAVLANDYWRSRFNANPKIIGREIHVDAYPVTIIGVAPRGFHGLHLGFDENIWLPLADQNLLSHITPKDAAFQSSNQMFGLELLGRLRPGVSRAQAQAAGSVLFQQATTTGAHPNFKPGDHPQLRLTSAAHGLRLLARQFSSTLYLLLGAVGLVLLIACANIAGLSLARASARQREIAMRLALGARRRRILRQLLTESLLLALLGAALGVGLAYAGAARLANFISHGGFFALNLNLIPDLRVLGFTLAITLLAAILSGLAPAWGATGFAIAPALKENPEQRALGRGWSAGNLLVVAQAGLAVLMLAGAGLLARSLLNLETRNIGFQPNHLLFMRLQFPDIDNANASMPAPSSKNSSAAMPAWQTASELRRRLAALPGMAYASYVSYVPLNGSLSSGSFYLHPPLGKHAKSAGDAILQQIGPKYFATLGIPLLAGRRFRWHEFAPPDSPPAQPVAIVNQAFAQKYLHGINPLGARLWQDSKHAPREIVGVVGNSLVSSLRDEMQPTIYFPEKLANFAFAMRTRGSATAMMPSIRALTKQVAPEAPIVYLRTEHRIIARSIYQERLIGGLIGLFALLVMALAYLGLYGLLAYEVARRRREIGIRMALGAAKPHVERMIIGRGLLLALAGIAAGLGAALALTRYITSRLYGLKPNDPVTLAAVGLLFLVLAGFACWLPARRAAGLDPWQSLRSE